MPAFRKLPPRYNGIVLPFFLSIVMCGIVSGVATIQAVGLAPDLPSQWLHGWAYSWPIAFPTLLLALPLMRRVTAVFVEIPRR